MKSIFELINKEYYTPLIFGKPTLPFINWIIGIPKHVHNNKKYYSSAFAFVFIDNFFYSILLFLGLLYNVDKLIYSAFIPYITMILITQITNICRVRKFNDSVYTKVCIRYFIISLLVLTISFFIAYIAIVYAIK